MTADQTVERATDSPIGGTSRFPRTPSTGPLRGRALRAGPIPWLVVGVALATGFMLAKWIDRRGYAHSRD